MSFPYPRPRHADDYALIYTEPDDWHQPVRHNLGAVLLQDPWVEEAGWTVQREPAGLTASRTGVSRGDGSRSGASSGDGRTAKPRPTGRAGCARENAMHTVDRYLLKNAFFIFLLANIVAYIFKGMELFPWLNALALGLCLLLFSLIRLTVRRYADEFGRPRELDDDLVVALGAYSQCFRRLYAVKHRLEVGDRREQESVR